MTCFIIQGKYITPKLLFQFLKQFFSSIYGNRDMALAEAYLDIFLVLLWKDHLWTVPKLQILPVFNIATTVGKRWEVEKRGLWREGKKV